MPRKTKEISKDSPKEGKPKKEPSKRRARPDDDDSSVDSNGDIIEDSDEEWVDSDTTTTEEKPPKKTGFKPRPKRKAATKAEKAIKEELETREEDEDEDEDEEEYEEGRGQIQLLISDFGGESGPPKPKKYKLKTESEAVQRFVKLVQTEEPEEDDIDRDIGYFKGLSPASQDKLLAKLQNKIEPAEPTIPLRFQILAKDVPAEVERVALSKYSALQNIDPSSPEFYKASQWVNGYTRLPLGIFKDLPVKLEDGNEPCQKFVTSVRKHMDDAIYGHDEAKLQILQFVSSWISNPAGAGNVLSIHGPPGVGKTTLIKDGVAKALDRPFHFITLGGATDSSYLDGHSYTYEGSTWGRIVDILLKSNCMNPIIYFDELDKVSDTPKGEEINNLLIHLTDGSQNDRFQDKYFTGIDLNLSRCLFIFSHNNHEKVNPILRDRMYNIQVGGFNLKEKLVISEQYLVNAALKDVNLFEKISITKEILTQIIENFTGDEKGVRELKRCIQTIVSKMNMLRFYNDPAKVPFAIPGFSLPFNLKKEHVELFLKKKAGLDPSIAHLYT
jgi:flagellar biosynthesis GTPase FlhF